MLLLGLEKHKILKDLEKQQIVQAGITDVTMDIFAIESSLLRTQKLLGHAKGEQAADMCAVLLRDAMAHIETTARTVVAACSEGDALRANLAVLRRFAKYEPVNAIGFRHGIARRLAEAERYVV